MSTVELKTELQQMIEREMDTRVLEAIRTILQKTSLVRWLGLAGHFLC